MFTFMFLSYREKKIEKKIVDFRGTAFSILWIRDAEKIPHTWNPGLPLIQKSKWERVG